MAVQVGLTTGSIKTTLSGNYTIIDIPGVTSAGSTFLQNLLTSRWYVLDTDSGGYIAYGATTDNPYDNLPQSYYTQKFYNNINNFVANTATSYGYDSTENFISYYNSGITAWREEAIAFNTWRDNTVSLMYDNIFSFTADGTTLPDIATGEFTGQAGYFDVGVTASRPNLFS